ncbi:S-adenosyl-L-methionine-dependent methyltransferase [Podospora aff. communis PSN243]|uniref:S-adenosyl-L-methionine-dependent methyltransferase n=1 Tax=Podospora aff. communis PSN243 TaxID=3040156 RepID=A0AAV9GFM5_9PEZI|nr:S-adenosyl-L-methionine-dependent methyltransferase [Podospora aff. communis PSN243]
MSGNAADESGPVEMLPASHWATQKPDDDADSTLDSVGSSTTSLSESILNYRELYGRTYHSERGNANYWAANDEKQNESMDISHHMNLLIFDGKIFQAPLDKGIKKALDIGTGTGNWAFDFADEFPECEVIGTDVSPIQPSWTPPNLKFEIEDCTQTWSFPDNSFDYVHIRWLVGSIPDWNALFAEAYRVLKPGGWLESLEPTDRIQGADGGIKPTDALGQWHQIFRAGGKIIGRDFDVYERGLQRKAFEAAGFNEVHSKDITIPLSQWPKDPKQKEIATAAQAFFTHDTEGFVLFVAATLGWKREEIEAYIKLSHQEIKSIKKRAQYAQRVVWGRKPVS